MDAVTVLGWAIAALMALASALWWQLNNRIKRIEDGKVDQSHCNIREQLAGEKFHGIEQRILDISDANKNDHNFLKEGMTSVQKDIRLSNRELAEITKCLALLSERIPCNPEAVRND